MTILTEPRNGFLSLILAGLLVAVSILWLYIFPVIGILYLCGFFPK